MILKHLDTNNLHHAYLIEGSDELVLPMLRTFVKNMDIETSQNPDYIEIKMDSFKIEDARNLKALAAEKSLNSKHRIFIISINSLLLEAQNTLLKMFEDPTGDNLFFLIIPDKNSLLKTLVSRFYFISLKEEDTEEKKKAEEFLKLPINARINFLKDMLKENEEEEITEDSPRSKALSFLNALENVLHQQVLTARLSLATEVGYFEHIFKARRFLRMPGSSAKNLMESVALVVPNFSK